MSRKYNATMCFLEEDTVATTFLTVNKRCPSPTNHLDVGLYFQLCHLACAVYVCPDERI